MTIVDKALAFATEAHNGQIRKYTGEPYITHPIAVAEIVKTVMHNDAMIAAAYLHDVVEDCGVSLLSIHQNFGHSVAAMVGGLTDRSLPGDGNRAARKAIDRAWLAQQDAATQTIKCADMIHNTASIAEHDPKFWKIYREEKLLLLAVLRLRADPVLWSRAHSQVVHN